MGKRSVANQIAAIFLMSVSEYPYDSSRFYARHVLSQKILLAVKDHCQHAHGPREEPAPAISLSRSTPSYSALPFDAVEDYISKVVGILGPGSMDVVENVSASTGDALSECYAFTYASILEAQYDVLSSVQHYQLPRPRYAYDTNDGLYDVAESATLSVMEILNGERAIGGVPLSYTVAVDAANDSFIQECIDTALQGLGGKTPAFEASALSPVNCSAIRDAASLSASLSCNFASLFSVLPAIPDPAHQRTYALSAVIKALPVLFITLSSEYRSRIGQYRGGGCDASLSSACISCLDVFFALLCDTVKALTDAMLRTLPTEGSDSIVASPSRSAFWSVLLSAAPTSDVPGDAQLREILSSRWLFIDQTGTHLYEPCDSSPPSSTLLFLLSQMQLAKAVVGNESFAAATGQCCRDIASEFQQCMPLSFSAAYSASFPSARTPPPQDNSFEEDILTNSHSRHASAVCDASFGELFIALQHLLALLCRMTFLSGSPPQSAPLLLNVPSLVSFGEILLSARFLTPPEADLSHPALQDALLSSLVSTFDVPFDTRLRGLSPHCVKYFNNSAEDDFLDTYRAVLSDAFYAPLSGLPPSRGCVAEPAPGPLLDPYTGPLYSELGTRYTYASEEKAYRCSMPLHALQSEAPSAAAPPAPHRAAPRAKAKNLSLHQFAKALQPCRKKGELPGLPEETQGPYVLRARREAPELGGGAAIVASTAVSTLFEYTRTPVAERLTHPKHLPAIVASRTSLQLRLAAMAAKQVYRRMRANKQAYTIGVELSRARKIARDLFGIVRRLQREGKDTFNREQRLRKDTEKRFLEEQAEQLQRNRLDRLIQQTEQYTSDLFRRARPERAGAAAQAPQDVPAAQASAPCGAPGAAPSTAPSAVPNAAPSAAPNAAPNASLNFEILRTPASFNGALKSYQRVGMSFLVHNYKLNVSSILSDDMGLGKTVQTIAFLLYLCEHYHAYGPFLVIAPNSLLFNWIREIRRFAPGLNVWPYWGSIKERQTIRRGWGTSISFNSSALAGAGEPGADEGLSWCSAVQNQNAGVLGNRASVFHVVVTSYQVAVSDIRALGVVPWRVVCLDEGQMIKSSDTKRWRTIMQYRSRSRILLSGTPIQNSLAELWSLLHFVMPDLFKSQEDFASWFSKDIENAASSLGAVKLNPAQLKRLQTILSPFVLRRVKTDVEKDLGEKEEIIVECAMSSRQRQLYDAIKERLGYAMIFGKTAQRGLDDDVLRNLVIQLRKVCCHPELFERGIIREPVILCARHTSRALPDADDPDGAAEEHDRIHSALQLNALDSAENGSAALSRCKSSASDLAVLSGAASMESLVQAEVAAVSSRIANTSVLVSQLRVSDGRGQALKRHRTSARKAAGAAGVAETAGVAGLEAVQGAAPEPALEPALRRGGTAARPPESPGAAGPAGALGLTRKRLESLTIAGMRAGGPRRSGPVTDCTTDSGIGDVLDDSSSYSEELIPLASSAAEKLAYKREPEPALAGPSLSNGAATCTPDPMQAAPPDNLLGPGSALNGRDPRASTAVVVKERKETPITRFISMLVTVGFDDAKRLSLLASEIRGGVSCRSAVEYHVPLLVYEDFVVQVGRFTSARLSNFETEASAVRLVSLFQEAPVLRAVSYLTGLSAASIATRCCLGLLTAGLAPSRIPTLRGTRYAAVQYAAFSVVETIIDFVSEQLAVCKHANALDYLGCASPIGHGCSFVAPRVAVSSADLTYLWLAAAAKDCYADVSYKLHCCRNIYRPKAMGLPPTVTFPVSDFNIFSAQPIDAEYFTSGGYTASRSSSAHEDSACVRNWVRSNFIHAVSPFSTSNEGEHVTNSLLSTPIDIPPMSKLITESGKLVALDNLLTELYIGGSPVLIYCQMTRMMDILEDYLTFRRYRYVRLDGSDNVSKRGQIVDKFMNDESVFVFLLSTRAASLGLNLTRASTVIFYESDWNPTQDSQAMDRVHRLGQRKQVRIYRLVIKNSIDERILIKAREKEIVQEIVLRGQKRDEHGNLIHTDAYDVKDKGKKKSVRDDLLFLLSM